MKTQWTLGIVGWPLLFLLVLEGNGDHHSNGELQEDRSYLARFDLDGDSVPDRVSFAFTGGAHCCYKPFIHLSSDSSERSYPFKMDGGYVGGVDGSKPEQFRIEDLDGDSIHEIFMRIEIYNGRQRDIPKKWTREYGIAQNRIYFDFSDDSLRVLDMK